MTKLISIIRSNTSLVGPVLFVLVLITPFPLEREPHVFLGIFLWVIYQWLFTPVPLFATGLMGVAMTALTGVTPAREALAPLADPLIFLFMGGFLLARSLEVLKLDRKISLALLSLPMIKGHLNRSIMAVYILTAFFSMWVSNTATTAMMLPIVLGLFKGLKIEDSSLKSSLLLGTAYSATIGGLATPIGSPPNIIALGMLNRLADINLSFIGWMAITLPIVIVLLTFLYHYTMRKIPQAILQLKTEFSTALDDENVKLTRKEGTVILLFVTAVFLWFSPSIISLVFGPNHELTQAIVRHLDPGIVSIFLASLLFIFPLRSEHKILNQAEAMKIDWGALLLFGTGLSLGQTLFSTGLATLAGSSVIGLMATTPFWIFLVILITFTIFMTEVASNTATANILIPLMIATALQAQTSPLITVLAVAISCNLAFMLPVATPPNAIVYGSGLVTLKDMAREGVVLNFVSIALLGILFTILTFFIS
jgi:solute carrier family 13 (sodium-dependent dicarboxylate transporter), member 2/3/5